MSVVSFSRSSDRTTCPDKPTEPSSHQKGCPSHPDGLAAAVRRLPMRPGPRWACDGTTGPRFRLVPLLRHASVQLFAGPRRADVSTESGVPRTEETIFTWGAPPLKFGAGA